MIVELLFGLLAVAVLYRVIRTAVAHGIADADEKRRRIERRVAEKGQPGR